MSGSITLHKKLGVNPRMTFKVCDICRNEFDGEELLLLGNKNFKEVCADCGAVGYGGFARKAGRKVCPRCASEKLTREKLSDYEKICTGFGICPECVERKKEFICCIQMIDNKNRSGLHLWMRKEVFLENIEAGDLRDEILEKGVCLILREDWLAMGLPESEEK